MKTKSFTFLFYVRQRTWTNWNKLKTVLNIKIPMGIIPCSSANGLSVTVHCFIAVKAGPHARLDSFSVGFTGGLVTSLRASNGQPVASLPFIRTRTQTAMTRTLARKTYGSAVEKASYWLDCIEEQENNCRASKSSGVARCLKVSWYIFNSCMCHSGEHKGVLE